MYLRRTGFQRESTTGARQRKGQIHPHAFTRNELSEFFAACDRRQVGDVGRRYGDIDSVFFRLLYSSGLRTCEARSSIKDVDRDRVLDVRTRKAMQTIGRSADTMLSLMRRYNLASWNLHPAKIFFPARKDNSHTRRWWRSTSRIWRDADSRTRTLQHPPLLRHNQHQQVDRSGRRFNSDSVPQQSMAHVLEIRGILSLTRFLMP